MFHRNIVTYLQFHTALQPRRQTLTSSQPSEPHISYRNHVPTRRVYSVRKKLASFRFVCRISKCVLPKRLLVRPSILHGNSTSEADCLSAGQYFLTFCITSLNIIISPSPCHKTGIILLGSLAKTRKLRVKNDRKVASSELFYIA